MAKYNVTFVPVLNRQPEVVEADDVCAISDYTVQFVGLDGRTTLVLGGVERVERVDVPSPTNIAVIDTTGKAVNVPRGETGDLDKESPITAS